MGWREGVEESRAKREGRDGEGWVEQEERSWGKKGGKENEQ